MRRRRAALLAWLAVVGLAPAARPADARQVRPDSVVRIPRDSTRPLAVDSARPIPVAPIVVTVLRTPLALNAAPYAVAVVDGERVGRGRPGLGLDEALRGVAGVQVDNRFNDALGERISIRGFGARAQFGVRGVKVIVDGIPATLPDGQTTLSHLDVAALGRLEVLRGPASMLYGNAAGGVIQLETAEPPPVPFRQEAGVTVGADGLVRIHGRAAGRTGGTSYLLDVARLSYDGYRAYSGADDLHATARFGWRSPRDELRFTAHFVDYDARNPGSLSAAQLAADRFQANGSNREQRTGEAGRHGEVGVVWRRAVGTRQLEVSAYALGRTVDNPIPPAIIDLGRRAGGVRALLRSGTRIAGHALRWTLGTEADAQLDDRRNFQNEQGERGALFLDQAESVVGLGTFVSLTLSLSEWLEVTGAARYDRFRFAAEDHLIADGDPDDSGHRTMDAVSPSVGVHLALSDALNLYGNATTAFATPTTTELANRPDGAGGFNPELEPERTRSFELGLKGRIAPGVTYQLAVYRATVEGALIPFEVAAAPGRQYFRNAGSTVHRGVEASASARLAPGLEARLAYAFTDARFDRYTAAAAPYDGNRLPGVAPHRLDATLAYDAPGGWYLALDGRYVAELPADDANTAFSAAYALAGARAGHTGLRIGRLELAPFAGVTNLLDTEYNTAVTVNAFGGRYYEPGPGRAAYAGLTARFAP